MKIILVIVAAIIGANIAEWQGFLFGAVVGWFLGAYLELRNEVREIRAAIDKLTQDRALATAQTAVSVQSAAPPAERRDAASAAPITSPTRPAVAEATPSVTPAASTQTASAWHPTSPAQAVTPSTAERAVQTVIQWVRDYFTGGNTLVRVGAIILFFGVGFLLKYAAEHTQVPIELRFAGVVFGAIVLLILGWRLRVKRLAYALALQGTAIGILYLVVFAAFRLYATLPGVFAFVLLAAICAVAAVLAILQNSLAFAVLGAIGGFLAPILVSTGQDSHVVLFSYYLVLNLGIFAIAWFKAWRELNLVGFLFTFIIGTAWGVLKYQADLFASTEAFLIAFFLLYVAIGVLYSARQSPQLRGYVDGTIVFGTPIVAFGLQSGMLWQDRYALAISAAAVSVVYLGLASAIFRSQRGGYRVLVEAFWALGVVFATLTVPLALDGHWTAATWALEGAAVLWLGCKQNRKLARAFGIFLQAAAGFALLRVAGIDIPWNDARGSIWLDAVLLASSAVFSSAVLTRNDERVAEYEKTCILILFFCGLLWWLVAWVSEIHRQLPGRFELHATLFVVAATAVICSVLAEQLAISVARLPALCLLPVMFLFAFIDPFDANHPAASAGFAVWPLSFAMFYWILWQHESSCSKQITSKLHTAALWLLLALASWEVSWCIDRLVQGSGSWPAIAWAVVPAVTLFCLPALSARVPWPIATHRITYLVAGGAGIAAFLLAWSLVTNLHLHGDPYPLPFVPLLNPLDLAQAAVLSAVVQWWWNCERSEVNVITRNRQIGFSVLGATIFIWLNAFLLRTLHHWAGIPFELDLMLRSTLVQTSLSIFWTLLALAIMVFATRRAMRALWFVGAVLMAVVVLKLFIVDLSRIGTVERIVSFIAVGALMLVIGYFAPLPPGQPAKQETV